MPKFKLMKVWIVDAANEEAAIKIFKDAPNQNKFLDWAGVKPLKNEDITKWRVLFRRERHGKVKGWVKPASQQVTGKSIA